MPLPDRTGPAPNAVLNLTPLAPARPATIPEPWPLPATDPAIIIPGVDPDGSLYPIEKIEAHVKGLHHQAISVFIFCCDELLIQRRAFQKYHCGGLWANTCCTHPHFGEAPKAAARRRLHEELGFAVPLEERLIVDYSADVGGGLREHERVHMFRAEVDKSDLTVKPNPDEVCDTRWLTLDALLADMANHPESYTPWFRIYVDHFPTFDF